MLHSPTIETKQQSDPSRTQAVPEPEPLLHPQANGISDLHPALNQVPGMPDRGTNGRQQQLSILQRTLGNQAVLRMLANSGSSATGAPEGNVASVLQRKCACGGSGGECATCKEKEEASLQGAAAGPDSVNEVPAIVHEVLRSPGQPLDATTRAFMEPRFGHDFSHVRVHSDAKAAKSARAVNALAYAVGRHVVFGPDQFKPHEAFGKQLLAHELTHVLQQGHHVGVSPSLLGVDDGGVRVEREANDNAEAVANDFTPMRVKSAERAKIRRAPPPAPTATRSTPAAKCEPESTAEGKELVSAQGTLEKSRTVADTILPPKPPSNLAYWFAELYYYITFYEIAGRSAFSYPAFVMHFIPIFYDMYAQNAEHFTKQQPEKIVPNWQEHFATASAIVDPSMVYPYVMAAQRSLIAGVSAHIKGDMPVALEQAYRTYSALYCGAPPFNTYHPDFFEHKPIFEKARIAFVNELINRGLGLAMYGKSVDPETLSKAADIIGAGLKIDEIYGWRETAWQSAKSKLS